MAQYIAVLPCPGTSATMWIVCDTTESALNDKTNSSAATAHLYMYKASAAGFPSRAFNNANAYCYLNGVLVINATGAATNYNFNSPNNTIGSIKDFGTNGITVVHNSDGTKSIAVSFGYSEPNNVIVGNTSGSGTMVLTRTYRPIWVKVAGVWKQAILWVKVAGVWKKTLPWFKTGGTWKNPS